MEFTNDIYFNDNLTSGKIATITYSGNLFKSGSESVNIVFGFSENWHYTTTLPMHKTENGFIAEIEIKDYDTFNFCFSNEYNNWDNNNNCNYISPILPKVDENITAENENFEYGADYSSSIDDIIEDILGNTVQNTIATNNESESIDKILESISEETLPEIEQLFNELFCIEYTNEKNIELNLNNEEDDFEDILATSVNTEDTNAELIRLFNELFESSTTPDFFENTANELSSESIVESNTQNIVEENNIESISEAQTAALETASFNLDGLVSDLLDSVITNSNTSEDVSLFEDIKEHENDEETSLTVVESRDLLVSPRKLSSFYKFKKRIKLACYKLFVKVPKQIAKQLGFGAN